MLMSHLFKHANALHIHGLYNALALYIQSSIQWNNIPVGRLEIIPSTVVLVSLFFYHDVGRI